MFQPVSHKITAGDVYEAFNKIEKQKQPDALKNALERLKPNELETLKKVKQFFQGQTVEVTPQELKSLHEKLVTLSTGEPLKKIKYKLQNILGGTKAEKKLAESALKNESIVEVALNLAKSQIEKFKKSHPGAVIKTPFYAFMKEKGKVVADKLCVAMTYTSKLRRQVTEKIVIKLPAAMPKKFQTQIVREFMEKITTAQFDKEMKSLLRKVKEKLPESKGVYNPTFDEEGNLKVQIDNPVFEGYIQSYTIPLSPPIPVTLRNNSIFLEVLKRRLEEG